jgi:hypothetical protein
MKCSVCKKNVGESFLGKIKGTYVRINGKTWPVCTECQSKHKNGVGDKLRQIFK